MKRNLFKTKVLVWMLLMMSSLSINTFGQAPPTGITAYSTCVGVLENNFTYHNFQLSGNLSGTPGRNTFTGVQTLFKRIIWENNRWEIQSSTDNGVTFTAVYYNTFQSAPFPPSLGTGTWVAVGNCDPLTGFSGTGTQTNLGTGGPITAIPSVTCAGALATYTFNYYVQNALPANANLFYLENIIQPSAFSNIIPFSNLNNNVAVKVNGTNLPINSTNFIQTLSWSLGVQLQLTSNISIPANSNIEVVLSGVLYNSLNSNATITWKAAASQGTTIQSYSTAFSPTSSNVPIPTFTQVAPICKGATLTELPSTSTNNITGIWLPAIDNLTTTTYTFTPNVGVCPSTATMTIVVKNTQVPQISSPQAFCQGQKVADLIAAGTALKWYNASSGGSELAATDALTATTYYVSQTVDGCESDRMPVVVTLKVGPSVQANSITTSPTACNIGTIGFAPNRFTDNTVLIDESLNGPNNSVFTIHKDAANIDGFVKLTRNENSKNGQLLFAKTSTAPKAFELKFDAFMLNKDGADGFSVNYGEIGNIQSLQEDGNATGLVLRFKNYNQDKIQLVYNNTQIGSDYNLTLEDGNWWTYTVTVSDIGQISLKRKRLDNTGSEISIFENITIPSYITTANHQWAFAARTGGQNNEHIIDAVKFTDKTPLQFSYDQTNWQTATTFTNVPAGFQTVYARSGDNGCPASLMNGSITVVGTTPPTPTFTQIDPICKGATLDPLPTTSTNNPTITGTWLPATMNNQATTTYTFTPTAGQCASTATMSITVNEPVTPTFSGNTVVLDKKNSDVANYSPFIVTTAATYRIELWGTGANGTPNNSGGGGGYTGTETSLAPASYSTGFLNSGLFASYFISPGGGSRISAEKAIGGVVPISLYAYNANGNSSTINRTASGGTKNIKGGSGNGGGGSGGGAAGWWGYTNSNLNGTTTAGGDSGTPDNSSDGGGGANLPGIFPGGGGGESSGLGAQGRILITKIATLLTTYCKGATINPLPTTSIEGITGVWTPALDNQATKTYTFTPTAGQCANSATMEIVVNEPVTPTFTQVVPICKGATLAALPTTSTNGISGIWSPNDPFNNQVTRTYTFTPTVTAGQCVSTASMTIVVNDVPAAPTGSPQTFCAGSTVADLVATGTDIKWYYFANSTTSIPSTDILSGGNLYFASQTVNSCESAKQLVSLTVKSKETPTFTQIGPICNGAILGALPTTSTNSIMGTWDPEVINNQATTTYTFTPSAGQCALGTASMTIVVNAAPPLPEIPSSQNGFLVSAENNTIGTCPDYRGIYAFPMPFGPYIVYRNQSNFAFSLVLYQQKWGIYIAGTLDPIFTNIEPIQGPVPPVSGWVRNPIFACTDNSITITTIKILNLCQGATVSNLKQNITGGVNAKFYDANNNPIYPANSDVLTSSNIFVTQTIDGCESAKLQLQIDLKPIVTPTFYQVAPICKDEALYITNLSDEGITGTWAPAFNNQATTTYTFTPESGICANTATMTVVVNQSVTATFTQVAPICKGASLAALPTYFGDIAGTWVPTLNNMATTTYTWTANAGQPCATTATMTIVVNNCSVISGTVLEDADAGTISGTPLTVSTAYLSIYKVGEAPQGRVSSDVPPLTPPLHVVPIVNGAYAFPILAEGKYKIVIGTSAAGSETASYPNVGNFSMTSSAEGEAGTVGDGTPDGITFVTITENNPPVYSGSRVRADAGISFAIKQLAPLPVRLISFTGKSTEIGNELTWKTSSEVNFSHFEVERSSPLAPDGGISNGKFEQIGKINGNSSEIYEFQDSTPPSGTGGLYRLKMIDLDGSFAYSKIIFIENNSEKNSVGNFYPNPSINQSFVEINVMEKGNWNITTFDLTGKILNSETKILQKGLNKISIEKLMQGVNFVRFESGLVSEIRKVLKE